MAEYRKLFKKLLKSLSPLTFMYEKEGITSLSHRKGTNLFFDVDQLDGIPHDMLNSNLKAMAGKTFLKATLQDIRMIRCSLNETLSLEEVIQRSNQAVKGAKLVMAIPHEDFATYTALIRVEEERALQSGIELVKEVEASIAESKQSKRKKRRKKNKTAVKGDVGGGQTEDVEESQSEGVGSEEVGGGQTKVGLELGADRDVGAVGARSNGAEYAVNGWDAIIGESKLLKYLIRSLEEKLMSKLDSIQVELRAELNVIHNELSTLYESECQGVAKKLAQLWKLSVEAGPFYRGFKILIPEDVRNKFHSIVSEILPNGSPPFPDPYYAASPSLTIPTRRSEIRPDFVLEVMGASIEPLSSPEAACLKSSGATSIIVVECSRSKTLSVNKFNRRRRDELSTSQRTLLAELLQLEKYVICIDLYYGKHASVGAILFSKSFSGLRMKQLDELACHIFEEYSELMNLKRLHSQGRFAFAHQLFA